MKRKSQSQRTAVKKNVAQVASPLRWRALLPLCLGLFLLVFWVFYPATQCGFINYDDDVYVTDNPHVQAGLTWAQAKWAFANTDAANWHPLTWLSHMLDCQLYGSNPPGHHLTSVLLHSANAVLLFLALRSLTGATGASLFAALLFALHPLRVESVAWIAERKDVLSGFFWCAAMWAYARYARERDGGRHAIFYFGLTLFLFACGLMSKPMVVTFPFVLLLIDFWPLRRWNRKDALRLVMEKVPFLVLSAASSVVTFLAQRGQGAVIGFLPFSYRLETAVLAYVRYLGKFFYPTNLAILYPHAKGWDLAGICGAAAVLLAISVWAAATWRRHPYFAMGWCWYLGTLVPVIGLIQVGSQSMADRYTYLPGIGLIVVLTFGIREAARLWRVPRFALAIGSAVILMACLFQTRHQIEFWKNSGTVFRHAIDVTENSFVARKALADYYSEQNKLGEAIALYREALQMYPNYEGAHLNLGAAYNATGRPQDAAAEFTNALALDPKDASVYNNLGAVLGANRLDESIQLFRQAVQLKPDYVDARMNLAQALDRKGAWPDAAEQYEATLRIRPNAAAHYYLAADLARLGRKEEAMEHLRATLRLEPNNQPAQQALQQLTAPVFKPTP